MSETRGTQQDITSAEEKGTTSEKEPETFTEQVAKIRSDAKAEIGRAVKAAEDATKAAKAVEERSAKFIKQQEEAELEAAKDDPERLSSVRVIQRNREADTKLAEKERELEEVRVKLAEAEEISSKSTKERNAREVAARLNVDAETLIKFTDGSAEAMEELAKSLPNKGETELTPDSGKTTGGTGLTVEKAKKMSPEDQNKNIEELAKLSLG